MRIWYQNKGLFANTFIANIPEHPDATDPFNLTKLQANDGRMAPRWVNLYGTHPDDRADNTKGRKEGSSFLGRVLLAFSLVANERPQLNAGQASAIKEPKTMAYQLWVDLYDLVDCDIVSSGSTIWVEVSMGWHRTGVQEKIVLKYKSRTNSYRYPPVKVPALEQLVLPYDFTQIPDIFIDFYSNTTFSSKFRIAYLRLKARDCTSVKPKPCWYRLSSPYNDTGNTNVGMLLANVQFLMDSTPTFRPERIIKTKSGKRTYKFFY